MLVMLVMISSVLLLPRSVLAEENITINADHIEHISETSSYIAKGSVIIEFEEASLKADELYLDRNTSDGTAIGNVVYEDDDTIISSDRIEMNLKSKLGTVLDGYIFYKKKHYHIQGGTIEKVGEKTFSMDRATVTTCDAESPAWRISGRNIQITQNKSIKAWHGSFQIKKFPILYTPYFWMPLTKKRESGFLFPSFGYSSKTGYYLKQGYYMAIKDNQDATVYLDYYSEKGLAQGLNYRFILSENTDGEMWMYQIKDKETSIKYFEFKSYFNHDFSKDLKSYVKIHAVNEFNYYQKLDSTSFNRFGLESWKFNPFGYGNDERVLKYLESNIQLSKTFDKGRSYVLAQFRQSLEEDSKEIPQSLPEAGLIINTLSKYFISYNFTLTGSNIWREEGQKGQRFDFNPNLYLSFGKSLNITQKFGLRSTAYYLNRPSLNLDRHVLDLETSVTSKLFKKYDSFFHIIEPVIFYTYTPSVNQNEITAFDSPDSFMNTSSVSYALRSTIRGYSPSQLNSKFVLSQGYDFLNNERPFSSILGEGSLISENLDLSLNSSYDVYENMIDVVIASLKLKGDKGYIGFGKNFRQSSSLDEYTAEGRLLNPIRIGRKSIPASLYGKLWYDMNTEMIEQSYLSTTYSRQCWGFTVSYTKKPSEYKILFGIELKGLGAGRIGSSDSPVMFTDPAGSNLDISNGL
jgi:LPS-assembly protein